MSEAKKTLQSLAPSMSVLGETIALRWNKSSELNVDFTQFCPKYGCEVIASGLKDTVILSSLQLQTDKEGNRFLFGGRAFSHSANRLVIGGDDVQRFGILASDIRASSGEFHLVQLMQDAIHFSADYFGLQSLFTYDFDGLQLVSTNYHLMLVLLKTLDADLEIDVEKSLKMLEEENVFGSGSAIEMKHCSVNEIDESFHLTSTGLSTVTDPVLHEELHSEEQEFDRDSYAKLITKARDEIVENVRMVFEYEGFDKIIVDLSGGLDSRVIYAACTAIEQTLVRDKIRINTQFGPSPNAKQGGDLEFAALINSLYNYPMWSSFDEEGAEFVDIANYEDDSKFHVNKISRLFGTHKNFNHVVPKYADYYSTNINRLSGFIGEVYRGANFVSSHGDKMTHINNYTNNRNRYMASRPFENILSPLASKHLLKASRMYQWNHEESLTVAPEMDVLTAINPLFSMMPFYNQDLREFLKATDKSELLNFPLNVRVECDFVDEPKNTAVRAKQNTNNFSQFVLDKEYASQMLDAVENFDDRYRRVVDSVRSKGDDMVRDRNARVLSMLWSIYFQIDIITSAPDSLV